MAKGKSIANYLFILLLLTFSNKQVAHSRASSPFFSFSKAKVSSSGTIAKPPVFITAHSVKKDRIKVRYMGGESSYDGVAISIAISSREFMAHLKGGKYVSFISSTHHFLYKLRGPPPIVC